MRSMVSSRRVASLMLAATVSLGVLVSAPLAAATAAVSFRITFTGCSIDGQGPANETIRIIHKNAAGHELGRATTTVDGGGGWSIPCLPGGVVRSGHRLVARDGSGATLRTFVVPPFSFHVDRATDRLTIVGPRSAKVSFVMEKCYPGFPTPTSCDDGAETLNPTTDPATGRYRKDLVYDVRGGDKGRLEWTNPATGDLLQWVRQVPYLQVERGSARVRGVARPGATVRLQLRRANGTLRDTASAKAASSGAWSARFRVRGSDVRVATGNRIRGDHASNGGLNAVATGARIDLSADTGHVTCLPNGRYGLTITDPGTDTQYRTWGQVGSSGVVDTAGVEVESGWVVRLWCASSKGDVVYRRSVIP